MRKEFQIFVERQFLLDVKRTLLKTYTNYLVDKQGLHLIEIHLLKHIVNLVHADVCYIKDRLVGGALYFVNFIDDHSRKMWTFALKYKNHLLDMFKQFHTRIEKQENS